MKPQLIILFIILLYNFSLGQSDQENLEKYWAYRDRLHKNFLRIGSDAGESIPMAARRVGYPYNHADGSSTSLDITSSVYWSDATIYLGHYIMVLSTEYALLHESGEKTESTLNELYFAIVALNRLDYKAETYLSFEENSLSQSNINGFLLRDDVPESFYDNFLQDYSEIFGQDCNFERVGSDYYVTNPFEGGAHTLAVNEANYQSLDQLTSIFSALLFAHQFVGNVDVQMPDLGISENIDDMIKSITLRLLNRLKVHEWRIAFWDGGVTPGNPGSGHNLTLAAPLIEDIAARIVGPFDAYFNTQIGEESIDIIELAIPKCRICDRIDEMLEFESWSSLLLLSPHLDIWYGIECTDLTGDCEGEFIDLSAPLGIIDAISLIPVNLQMSDIRNAVASVEQQNLGVNTTNSGSSKICLEIEKDIELGIEGFASINFEVPISICIRKGTLFGLFDNLIFDNIADNMQDDNVHIFLELATCSNVWGFDYVTTQAHLSGMDHYSLMHAALNHNGQPWGSMDQYWYKSHFINSAPCEGPHAHPYIKSENTGPVWASQNRLFHPANAEFGPLDASGNPQTDFRGEFSGLDFMLYHNLYWMLWGNPNNFTRNIACDCSENFIEESALNNTMNVEPKFSDYKLMNIPIESILSHDLIVSSLSGELNVHNNLLICRELPEVQTTLRIENGAILNLFEENTITVREGNRIVLTAGGQLLAGLDDDNSIHTAATIVLEENAELIVEDEASIVCYGGLNLIMKPGSQFTLFGGDCITAGEGFDGIFFDANGAIISLTNATLISNDHFGHPNSTINNTEITTIHSQVHFSRSETSIFETHLDESNFSLDGSSSLFVSAPVTISHGELDVSTTSKLYIHYGNLTIGESALLDWHSNTCEIIGGNASLAFDHGQIHIPSNHEFTFEYGGQQSGFIDIKPGSTNVIINDNNSIFRIHGFGKEDLCLRVSDATLKNINPQLGKFILSNCQIEMEGGGDIVTDMFFDASNCKFIGGKSELWYSPAYIYACDFEHSFINSKFQKIIVKHSHFMQSALHADGSVYAIENTRFDASHIHSENLSAVSFIKNCDFTNDEFIFVADESLVELRITESEFTSDGYFHLDNSPYGIFKAGGILTLKCNKFKDLNEAIHGANGCIISMTENDNSGNNQFTHCNHMIVCEDALDLKINDGYNDFSDVVSTVFTGNLTGYACNNIPNTDICDNPELLANSNVWFHSSPPEEPNNEFNASESGVCSGYSLWSNCIITIVDNSPITEFTCRDKTPIGKIEKSTEYAGGNGNSETFKYVPEVNSNLANMYKDFAVGNPNITTTSFENIPLEEALLFAANTSELIDSLGNDSLSIDLFHQIVMSDIDLDDEEIRWKLLWGQRHMKSALENRFSQGEITQQSNEINFHSDVQKYVDVLNTLTYQTVPDSEYTLQYYLELDKGQLFNTLGNYEMANQLFMSLDDCEIDSLEQEILNGWILQTLMAIDETSQYLAGVPIDSIQGAADTSSLLTPIVFLTDTYFFGAIIHSPQFVEFAPCELSNRNLRTPKSDDQAIKVYPNPSQGSFTVQNSSKQVIHSIDIIDRSGRCIFTSGSITADQQTLQINLAPNIASGLYTLKINLGETCTYKTIAIQ